MIRCKLWLLLIFLSFSLFLKAQSRIYAVTSGEMIFGWSDVSYNPNSSFFSKNGNQYSESSIDQSRMRVTFFFHLGQYWHYDLTNNIGFLSGIGVRNVGLTTDEFIDIKDNNGGTTGNGEPDAYKIVRRSYLLGVPLGVKMGSFKDHFFLMAGGEVELSTHFKEKYWESHSRSGLKSKNSQWFGQQTPRFMPSLFAGIQFPRGVHLKVKYYLNDFLNANYTSTNDISDLSRYATSNVYYVSLSWQLNTSKIKDSVRKDDGLVTLR